MVIVMRCSDGPEFVPSRIVTCAECQAECWLSLASGESTLRLARLQGDDKIICLQCLYRSLNPSNPDQPGETDLTCYTSHPQ